MLRKTTLLFLIAPALVLPTISAWAVEPHIDYYAQAEFAFALEKWARAVELFTKCIENKPDFFMAYHNRAIAYAKLGEYDKSIQDLKKAIELNPDYPDTYGRLGVVHEIKKEYGEALKRFQEAAAREKRPTVQRVIQKYIQDLEQKLKNK